MSDVLHVNSSAKSISGSPLYEPISKVRIIYGKNEDGEQLVEEAGDESGRVLEIENPYGEGKAAAILARVRGKRYQPFSVSGALIDPAVELGDAVYAGGIYGVINECNTTFSALMPANIGSMDDGDIDHEYPYEAPASRETIREMNGLKTSFTVELGKIATEISETYETKSAASSEYHSLESSITQTKSSILSTVQHTYESKTAAQTKYNNLESQIEQTAESITLSVSQTYETKIDANNKYGDATDYADTIKKDMEASIALTASEIKSTVAKYEDKWDISEAEARGYNITQFGYGTTLDVKWVKDHAREYYLDNETGYYYLLNANGTKTKKGSLSLVSENLYSAITQSSTEISMEVSSDTEGRTEFVLKAGEASFSTGYLNLTVNSAYIEGDITANGIVRGSTIESPTINAGTLTNATMNFTNSFGGEIASIYAYGNVLNISCTQGVWLDRGLDITGFLSVKNGVVNFLNASQVIMPDGTVFEAS